MLGENGNSLVVIENGKILTYLLDDKNIWKLGRISENEIPDIRLHSPIVSRKQGTLYNMDGSWFYMERKVKNAAIHNGKPIKEGIGGRIKPIFLADGDTLVFGNTDEGYNSKSVFVVYFSRIFTESWRVEDTRGMDNRLVFSDGMDSSIYTNPIKGMVVMTDMGVAIYMGDITYLMGNIEVKPL